MHHSSTDSYRKVHVSTGMVDADPYTMVQMLFQGVLDRLARAKGHIARNDGEARNNELKRAIEIIDYLRMTLDHQASETLTAKLENLYNYMEDQLFIANTSNDSRKVDEVAHLLITLKSGWDNIPAEERKPTRSGVLQ